MSAVSGFPGVGGKCGFDLKTDRLVQAMYIPLRTSAEAPPAEMVVTQGSALDWVGLLDATDFDLEASLEARRGGKPNPNRRMPRQSNFNAPLPVSSAEWGPLGQALMADGRIGREKNWEKFHVVCTHAERHTNGVSENYAIYRPANDTFWCPSSGCAGASPPLHQDRPAIVSRLSPHAQAVYARLTDAKFRGERLNRPASWASLAGDEQALGAWVTEQGDMFPKEQVTEAMIGALLAAGWDPDLIRRAARVVLGPVAGDATALKVLANARRRKGRVAQQGRLRDLLNPRQLAGISEALEKLSGVGRDKIARWGGRGTVRDANAQWLIDVGETLPLHEKHFRNTLIRPAGCCRYADHVIVDGTPQGKRILVCESPACAECWVKRVECEASIVNHRWEEDERYAVIKVGLPDEESLDRFEKTVCKRIKNSPRLKLHGRDEKGRPTLTFVGTRSGLAQTRATLIGPCTSPKRAVAFARERADEVSFECSLDATKAEAISAVVQARLSLHFHHGGAVHAHDRDTLESFVGFLRPRRKEGKRGSRQLVSHGPESLSWPNRDAIREFCRKGEPAVDLSECYSVEFQLHDAKYEWFLHASERRHSLPNAMQIAAYSREFQAAKDVMDAPRDREQERLDELEAKTAPVSWASIPSTYLRL